MFGSTKTSRTRYLPVSARLAADLRLLVLATGRDGFLFRGPRGVNAWQPDNFRSRVWAKAIVGTEFAAMGLTPHDLRHTAASMLIAAGAHVKVVQSMLGHASATETLDRYAHLWPDRLDVITEAVEAARWAQRGSAA